MDPGARADRAYHRRADARRQRRQLALRRARAAAAALLWCALAQAGAGGYLWQLPRGFPEPAVPADNPMSAAKVALGARLFYEPRLSVSGRYSCASCHEPAHAFAQPQRRAAGATGATLAHNAMALVNVAYNLSFGWTDSGLHSLEAQMRVPLLNEHPIEMGVKGHEAALCAALAADKGYAAAFAAAFPGEAVPLTFDNLIRAIASYERTLISGGSPFDRYVFAGEHAALSPLAKQGMTLFFSKRAGCALCHSGINFAGNWRDAQGATGPASFANNGTGAVKLRVPTLRNVALTAPYMHDGRFATLDAVLEHYSVQAARAPRPDPRLPAVPFSAAERRALRAFLDALTDEAFVARARAVYAARGATAAP